MTKILQALKRFFKVGYFQKPLIVDKCRTAMTDIACPRPATCAEYYRGQFGHKVLSLYCEECYIKWKTSPYYRPLYAIDFEEERIFTLKIPKSIPAFWSDPSYWSDDIEYAKDGSSHI